MRKIVLDTETTGLSTEDGHRIIEIGCIEIVNRQVIQTHYHQYINPNRKIDVEATRVHGISIEDLHDKPNFADIAPEFMQFIDGAELIIHNAPFDVGFIDYELQLLKQNWKPLDQYCTIFDTLALAKKIHPSQRNTLDALCKRYNIDSSKRTLHGALLDSELLAELYLIITGGQVSLLGKEVTSSKTQDNMIKRISSKRAPLAIQSPTVEELKHHQTCLTAIDTESGGKCLWRTL
ncbi:MAG: DNA polymerase III subunit epsilon [Thiomargarita sp.]|nr:DNA polymerase III subunit epsilon [Thiomargarita sp.]